MPRLKGNGALDNRMASYGDVMVATAGLLSAMNLPQVTQGYWTEHSERAVIPTGLSVLETPPMDKDEDSESGEASSAHTGDGEEPWYEATWEGWDRASGPVDGADVPAVPQIDAATRLDFNQSLYDFIRERM